MAETKIIKPQKGYQLKVLTSPADIVIGGGAAGAGKTFSLLMDFLRGINKPDYNGVIFRRTSPQITAGGGLWDTSESLFSAINGAVQKPSNYSWVFESGAKLKFSHLQYEKDKLNWQGSQVCFLGFDELTHFTESQFFYLLSRNRSTCGIAPFVRCTCNPDADSWVARLIEWWICQDKESPKFGLPIPEREGIIRYFTRSGGAFVWGETKEEVVRKCPEIVEMAQKAGIEVNHFVKSLTFISGSIYENKKLLEIDPAYLANLNSQDTATKAQLLDGNWKISVSGNSLFDYFSVDDLDSNFLPETVKNEKGEDVPRDQKGAVSCDVAGEGADRAFVYGWRGMQIVCIRILSKCTQPELEAEIEIVRQFVGAQKSRTTVDADGIGIGLAQYGKYKAFQNNSSPIHPREAKRDPNLKANFPNLKTQCYHKLADLVNSGMVSFRGAEIWVDGVQKNTLHIAGKGEVSVLQIIKEDLGAVKKEKQDMDGKKQINGKDNQKELLGRSPDGGDGMMMRMIFELEPAFEILESTPRPFQLGF